MRTRRLLIGPALSPKAGFFVRNAARLRSKPAPSAASPCRSTALDGHSRIQEFALSLHSEKTRLMEFGRFAVENRKRRGLGKPETFTFLGFTFICSKTRRGKFQIRRKSRRDRMQAKLQAIKQELRRSMHQPIPQQGRWLQQVVTGYFNYHAVPTNRSSLTAFLFHVTNLWRRTLQWRSQKDGMTWERIKRLADNWLPKPRILHPWPESRFAVRHPRWGPYARIGLVRICAGDAG
jgi:RNA-directed DNA polymerase